MWKIIPNSELRKRDQGEQQVSDPYWDENYDTSPEDGKGCVCYLLTRSYHQSPKKKRKSGKSKLRQQWMPH